MTSYSTEIQKTRDTFKTLLNIYAESKDKLIENDNITQDILHQLELGSYNDGRKYYGKLRRARKERRVHKDTLETLEKFHELMSSDLGVQFLRYLDEVLGDARKKERILANRHYVAKSIKNLPISPSVKSD